jgi:hypothetical protein
MKIRTLAALFGLLLFLGVGLPAATTSFPVDELRPGMVGVGKTVFQGEALEDFKVHILGVLRNVIGTRRNLILAKLEGGPLADTGVIAGMSGSPVYIDGRLVGASRTRLDSFRRNRSPASRRLTKWSRRPRSHTAPPRFARCAADAADA